MYVQNVLDQFELKLIQILLRPEKKTYSHMAIGRNDKYIQLVPKKMLSSVRKYV